jgi:hypothetical protein
VNELYRRMLAAAVIEQAVIDVRIAKHHNLIDKETLEANKDLPDKLPQLLTVDDIQTLKSFITTDLESFISATGLYLEASAIRRGIKSSQESSFKKFCSESSIQSYERRWRTDPLQPNKPAKRRRGGRKKRS